MSHFSAGVFSSKSTEDLRMRTFLCFRKYSDTTKCFWIRRRGGGGVKQGMSRLSIEKNFSHSAGKSSRETLRWFRKSRVSRSFMRETEKGVMSFSRIFFVSQYHNFRMGIFLCFGNF